MTTIDHFVTPEELMAFRDGELPFERAAAIRAARAGLSRVPAAERDARERVG